MPHHGVLIRWDMAKVWKPESIETYQQWVNDILGEASEELTQWESTFIGDMQIRLAQRWILTQGQAEKLEDIYARYTK